MRMREVTGPGTIPRGEPEQLDRWQDCVEVLMNLCYLAQQGENCAETAGYLKQSDLYLQRLMEILEAGPQGKGRRPRG